MNITVKSLIYVGDEESYKDLVKLTSYKKNRIPNVEIDDVLSWILFDYILSDEFKSKLARELVSEIEFYERVQMEGNNE